MPPLSTEPIVKPSHPSHLRALACVFVLLAVAGAALLAAPDARAAQGAETVVCWKRLLNDWFDGRIDNAYPVRCYREAIKNLPDDVKVYADAEEDIRRALFEAMRASKRQSGGVLPTEETPVKPPSKPTAPTTTEDPEDEEQAGGPTAAPPTDPPPPTEIATGATRSADSIPLPLMVLGALALLLLAAAGAGMVARRVQARRFPATGPPREEPPPVS